MSEKTLSLALRPTTLAGMFGQQKITSAIVSQLSKRVPATWMFCGETGSGKTTLARILATHLACPHEIEDWLTVTCKKCYRAKRFNEINCAVLGGIDDIKQLAQSSEFAPQPPAVRRVYIVDEAQRITKQAQAVLLKYLEDAPATTVWILCTTDPQSILSAIRSRAMVHQLAPLRGKEVERFLRWVVAEAGIARDLGPFIDQVHERGITSARILLNALEKYEAGLDPEAAIQSIDSEIDTKRICQALLRGDFNPVRSEMEKATTDDARIVRGAVLGYFKAIMLARQTTSDKNNIAWAIKELGSFGYQDENTYLVLLIGALWRICKKL